MGWGAARLVAAALLLLAVRAEHTAPRTFADMFPFIALVTTKESPLCSGALVAPSLVLTSASCATIRESKPSLVFLGMHNIFLDEFRRDGEYEIRKVDAVLAHPDFREEDLNQNNLALLVLSKPSRHTPVTVANASFAYPFNTTAVRALGYGSLSADGFFPQLHADDLTLLPQEECGGLQTAYGRWWGSAQTEGGPAVQACTALSHSFRACASGNAGAPLILPRSGPDGGPLQLGLLTSGFSCSTDPAVASASSPALYTWLPRYSDWLARRLSAAQEEEGQQQDREETGQGQGAQDAGGSKETKEPAHTQS